uniref:solute carrier organic anion transporter family member 6A1 n=1 Tax=Jaculus jaculus TaxID=51337 RepID=UPI001E1B5AF7|nr:solute carrier organic anion transporter family member 6A1 [Jaculus jaculus]
MDHHQKQEPKDKSIEEMSNNVEQTFTSVHTEGSKSLRQSPYMTTAAMIKFTNLQKKKRSTATESQDSKTIVSLEGPYGLGNITFPALQRFNNIRFFLLLYCTLVMCQGAVFGLVHLSTATFAKEYYLGRSTKLALSLTYDISSCLLVLFVAYYGGRGSRTKWVAISSLLVGFGAILLAIPNQKVTNLKPSEGAEAMCKDLKDSDGCPKHKQAFQSKFISFFILGQTLQGMAALPLYILGKSFMDDSVPLHSTGIYLGFWWQLVLSAQRGGLSEALVGFQRTGMGVHGQLAWCVQVHGGSGKCDGVSKPGDACGATLAYLRTGLLSTGIAILNLQAWVQLLWPAWVRTRGCGVAVSGTTFLSLDHGWRYADLPGLRVGVQVGSESDGAPKPGLGEASEVFGYGLGIAIGSPQLTIQKRNDSYEKDQENDSDPDQTTRHQNNEDDEVVYWKVSWGACFISASVVAWSTFLPLLCFPHTIPGTFKIRAVKEKQLPLFDRKLKDVVLGPYLRDLFRAVWALMQNPMMMSQAFSKASEYLAFIGASEFMPIYIENQFLLSPSLATMLTGILLIPAGALGTFLGGFIVSKLEMSYRSLMRFTMATSTIAVIFLSLVIFVSCETVPFAGINENYDGTGELGNLTAPCNAHCGCSSSIYSSVCGRDEVEYFSPCFAGCVMSKHINERKVFYNCSCIKQGLGTSEEAEFVDAVAGKCNTSCYKLPLFFAFMFCSIVYCSLSIIPINLIILRTVPEKLRSLALGLNFFIFRVFGTIPGPLIFKLMAETSCTFWDVSQCGFKGHCWIYNKTKMVYILVGICFLCKTCSVFFTAIGYYASSSYEEENNDGIPLLVKKAKADQKSHARSYSRTAGKAVCTSFLFFKGASIYVSANIAILRTSFTETDWPSPDLSSSVQPLICRRCTAVVERTFAKASTKSVVSFRMGTPGDHGPQCPGSGKGSARAGWGPAHLAARGGVALGPGGSRGQRPGRRRWAGCGPVQGGATTPSRSPGPLAASAQNPC